MINAFYAREKKRHSAAQHTGENPFGHTVQWLQTNKYEIYIFILLLSCITSVDTFQFNCFLFPKYDKISANILRYF